MEREGWIRIHHDEVRYWGFRKLNFTPPTQQQIDALVKYANACYKGKLCIGNRDISAAKLAQTERLMLERIFTL